MGSALLPRRKSGAAAQSGATTLKKLNTNKEERLLIKFRVARCIAGEGE
jgi:hypothetical protein